MDDKGAFDLLEDFTLIIQGCRQKKILGVVGDTIGVVRVVNSNGTWLIICKLYLFIWKILLKKVTQMIKLFKIARVFELEIFFTLKPIFV